MVLFVEKGNELFEVLLCELRHEVIGKFGEMVTRGIFPTTVEQILDIEGHIKIVREKLEPIPKTVTVIVYVTGCQPLLQSFYVWLNNAYVSLFCRELFWHITIDPEKITGIFAQIMVMKYTFRNLQADFGSSPGVVPNHSPSTILEIPSGRDVLAFHPII